jgi:hypothetical protein
MSPCSGLQGFCTHRILCYTGALTIIGVTSTGARERAVPHLQRAGEAAARVGGAAEGARHAQRVPAIQIRDRAVGGIWRPLRSRGKATIHGARQIDAPGEHRTALRTRLKQSAEQT